MSLLCKLYPRGPVDVGPRGFCGRTEASPVSRSGARFTRHTEGHVSLFRGRNRLLIAGDAFVTTKQESFLAVATQRPELHGPPAYFTTDWDAARVSVERLAALLPAAVATGHGRPLPGPELAGSLSALARAFDTVARPAHGVYVSEPGA